MTGPVAPPPDPNPDPDAPQGEIEASLGNHLPVPDFARADRRSHLWGERLDLSRAPKTTGKDWRDAGVVSQAKSQGDCGACTSFAIAATVEALLRIANPSDTTEVDVGFLHSCVAHRGQIADPVRDCASGADLKPVLQEVVRSGYALMTPQSRYPASAASCHDRGRTGLAFRELNGPNAAKAALLEGPIVSEMYFWRDFTDAHRGRDIYRPDKRGPVYFHSVCIIGFSSVGWIIKNSFGSGWGVGGGFATLPYDTCGIFSPHPPNAYPAQTFSVFLQG